MKLRKIDLERMRAARHYLAGRDRVTRDHELVAREKRNAARRTQKGKARRGT